VVQGRFGGRRRRRWTDPRDYPGSTGRGGRLPTATVAIVLAAAVGVGLAVGVFGSKAPAARVQAFDKPILWNETQAVPRAAIAPEDAAWAAGGAPGAASRPAPAGAAASANIPFFGYCHIGGGANCVVDGDTFYFGRDKVRIANIDAPETHPPRCASEARLGEAATHRLRDLLNSGEVSLSSIDRDEDPYGRKLRNVSVGGADVGAALVAEGLARDYGGGRRSWCG
jgi:endonuclease YncB( thermonuclease family)